MFLTLITVCWLPHVLTKKGSHFLAPSVHPPYLLKFPLMSGLFGNIGNTIKCDIHIGNQLPWIALRYKLISVADFIWRTGSPTRQWSDTPNPPFITQSPFPTLYSVLNKAACVLTCPWVWHWSNVVLLLVFMTVLEVYCKCLNVHKSRGFLWSPTFMIWVIWSPVLYILCSILKYIIGPFS